MQEVHAPQASGEEEEKAGLGAQASEDQEDQVLVHRLSRWSGVCDLRSNSDTVDGYVLEGSSVCSEYLQCYCISRSKCIWDQMKNKKKIEYKISLSYPVEEYPTLDKFYEGLVGRKRGSSGLGFGRRDIEWYTKSKDMRTRIFNKLKKNLRPGVEVDVMEVGV